MKLQLAAGFVTALLLAAPTYAQDYGASGFSAKERAAFTAPAHAKTTKTKVQDFGASGFSEKERAAFTAPAHARTTTKTKVVSRRKHKIG